MSNEYYIDSLPYQQDLLADSTKWNALLILDACRYDYLKDEIDSINKSSPDSVQKVQVSPVRTFTHTTILWMYSVMPIFARRKVRYYTANPQTNIQLKKHYPRIPVESIWDKGWWRTTRLSIPSVNPWTVNGWVLADLQHRIQKGAYPIVVHYIQPHFPAIGEPPMKVGAWGTITNPFSKATKDECPQPLKELANGVITIEQYREAYRGNVRLVAEAALALANNIKGPVIITADHGEALGEYEEREDGQKVMRIGHSDRYKQLNNELLVVPWIVVNPTPDERTEEEKMHERLNALGYE